MVRREAAKIELMQRDRLIIREASKEDLPSIIKFLGVDEISGSREGFSTEVNEKHLNAFEEISKDNNNELIVAEHEDKVVGTLQITYITYLTGQGETRALVESMMVCPENRGKGIGSELMKWAIERAQSKNCGIIQLTSHNDRSKAHNFYKRFGFTPTHLGFKLCFGKGYETN